MPHPPIPCPPPPIVRPSRTSVERAARITFCYEHILCQSLQVFKSVRLLSRASILSLCMHIHTHTLSLLQTCHARRTRATNCKLTHPNTQTHTHRHTYTTFCRRDFGEMLVRKDICSSSSISTAHTPTSPCTRRQKGGGRGRVEEGGMGGGRENRGGEDVSVLVVAYTLDFLWTYWASRYAGKSRAMGTRKESGEGARVEGETARHEEAGREK